jgi:hypothetical protein
MHGEILDHIQGHEIAAELWLFDGAQGRHHLFLGHCCHTSPPLMNLYPSRSPGNSFMMARLIGWRSFAGVAPRLGSNDHER